MTAPWTPTPEGRVIDTGASRVWMGADGVAWNWVTTGEKLTASDARAIVAALCEVAGGRPAPLLVVVNVRAAGLTHEARVYFNSEEAKASITSLALLAKSRVARMAANLYLRVIRPNVPMRLFADHEEARAWLQGFVA